MAATSSLFLYSLTLQPSNASTQSIVGSFVEKSKEQQIVSANGSILTISTIDRIGRHVPIHSHNVFGTIRSLKSFRMASDKDHILVGSDSGSLAVLEYIPNPKSFRVVFLETFGKSGVRRAVPGQYLAVDTRGRVCMIAAVEKHKLCYVFGRGADNLLTISSPQQANTHNVIVTALVALDVPYHNPQFAALEVDHGDNDPNAVHTSSDAFEKQLVLYEFDPGLNRCTRQPGVPVDQTANMLLHVPGGNEGPGGVLVCSSGYITYHCDGQDVLRVPIPRRTGPTENPFRSRRIVCGLFSKSALGDFHLLQTEDGDLFKITVEVKDNTATPASAAAKKVAVALKLSYFDTFPVASSIAVLRHGFGVAHCETGDDIIYQLISLGSEQDEVFEGKKYIPGTSMADEPSYFTPRALKHFKYIANLPNLNPIMASKVTNLTGDDVPQIYAVSGTGARSSFRTLRNGLEVSVEHQFDRTFLPQEVWSFKTSDDSATDEYFVLSSSDSTYVQPVIDHLNDDQFYGLVVKYPTLNVRRMGANTIVQVHRRGIRLVNVSGSTLVKNDWDAPQNRSVVAAASNSRQLAIGLSNGQLYYFELDDEGGLDEFDDHPQMSASITSLSIGEISHGRLRSPFLAIGCDDETVRVLSLDPDNCFEALSTRGLSSIPSSLSITPLADSSTGGSILYLHVGLRSGLYLKTVLDEATGDLGASSTRFVGVRPVRLTPVSVQGQNAILALSSKTWLGYPEPQTRAFKLRPLDVPALDIACSVLTNAGPQIMTATGKTIQVFTIPVLYDRPLQEKIPLMYTPRNLERHPLHSVFYVMESDFNVLSRSLQAQLLEEAGAMNGDMAMLPPDTFGYPRGQNRWASCIEIIDPIKDHKVISTVHLPEGQCATSMAVVPLASQDGQYFLIVGVAKNLIPMPRKHEGGLIYVYAFQDEGRALELMHVTEVNAPPTAIKPFQGRMLVGIETHLMLYDVGMKQCLRKVMAAVVPTLVVGIETNGLRIAVSDQTESVTLVAFQEDPILFAPFADDTVARWTSCTEFTDHDSVMGGDKFGNIWLLRCPDAVSKEADEAGGPQALSHGRSFMGGTEHRVSLEAHFHTMDIPTSITKCTLAAGGNPVMVWTGLRGTIGVLVPFVGREEVNFFMQLEQELRETDAPLLGRDHLTYRSYYATVKSVVDGDLCERFTQLSRGDKLFVAGKMECDVQEIEKRVSDMRIRAAY